MPEAESDTKNTAQTGYWMLLPGPLQELRLAPSRGGLTPWRQNDLKTRTSLGQLRLPTPPPLTLYWDT